MVQSTSVAKLTTDELLFFRIAVAIRIIDGGTNPGVGIRSRPFLAFDRSEVLTLALVVTEVESGLVGVVARLRARILGDAITRIPITELSFLLALVGGLVIPEPPLTDRPLTRVVVRTIRRRLTRSRHTGTLLADRPVTTVSNRTSDTPVPLPEGLKTQVLGHALEISAGILLLRFLVAEVKSNDVVIRAVDTRILTRSSVEVTRIPRAPTLVGTVGVITTEELANAVYAALALFAVAISLTSFRIVGNLRETTAVNTHLTFEAVFDAVALILRLRLFLDSTAPVKALLITRTIPVLGAIRWRRCRTDTAVADLLVRTVAVLNALRILRRAFALITNLIVRTVTILPTLGWIVDALPTITTMVRQAIRGNEALGNTLIRRGNPPELVRITRIHAPGNGDDGDDDCDDTVVLADHDFFLQKGFVSVSVFRL